MVFQVKEQICTSCTQPRRWSKEGEQVTAGPRTAGSPSSCPSPKELGGQGGPGTNPEQLFAVGYAACFHSGLLAVAQGRKLDASDSTVTAQVGIGPTGRGGFGLAVALDLYARCPDSNATRGNVDVTLRVDGTQLERPAA